MQSYVQGLLKLREKEQEIREFWRAENKFQKSGFIPWKIGLDNLWLHRFLKVCNQSIDSTEHLRGYPHCRIDSNREKNIQKYWYALYGCDMGYTAEKAPWRKEKHFFQQLSVKIEPESASHEITLAINGINDIQQYPNGHKGNGVQPVSYTHLTLPTT